MPGQGMERSARPPARRVTAPPKPGQRCPGAWPVTHVGKHDPMAPAHQVNE